MQYQDPMTVFTVTFIVLQTQYKLTPQVAPAVLELLLTVVLDPSEKGIGPEEVSSLTT